MSARTLRWAQRQRVEDATLKAVLLTLGDAADPAATCGLTQAEIARRAGRKERAVRGALSLLARFEVIRREGRGARGLRGRQPDLIILAIERDFDLSKMEIMEARSPASECREMDGSNRHINAGKSVGASGSVPVAPKSENGDRLYRERARAPINGAPLPPSDVSTVQTSSRSWWDRSRSMWRAVVRFEGLEMDLRRFSFRDEAEAACRNAVADIEHASTHKAGLPREPVQHPDLESLNGAALSKWFDDESIPDITRRTAAGDRVRDQSPDQGYGDGSPCDRPQDEAPGSTDSKSGSGEDDFGW